jgi:anti-anti-sigma factor
LQPFIAKAALGNEIETMEYLYGMDTIENVAVQPLRTVREVDVLKSLKSTSTSHLAIAVDHNETEAIVRLNGRIDVDSSPDVRNCLLTILAGKQLVHVVTVDLGDVIHIEASGIATLVEALKIAGPRQIRLRLQGLHGSALRLFEVTGLLPLFETIHGGKGVA